MTTIEGTNALMKRCLSRTAQPSADEMVEFIEQRGWVLDEPEKWRLDDEYGYSLKSLEDAYSQEMCSQELTWAAIGVMASVLVAAAIIGVGFLYFVGWLK